VIAAGSVLLVALSALALLAPVASAAESRSYTGASFGPDGPGAATDFSLPGPVAVDPDLGAVYVADTEAGIVYKFDESGEPVDFVSTGSPDLEGFTFYAGLGESQLAVDPSTHAIYVLGNGNGGLGAVEAFDASGAPREFPALGASEILGSEGDEFCGVAVDAAGDIYVGDYYHGVSIYAPSGELIKTVPAGHPCNVAVDAGSNLYAGQWEGAVERLVPSSVPPTAGTTYETTGTVGGAVARTVYADPRAGPVFVDEGGAITEVGIGGGSIHRFGEGGEIVGSEGAAYSSASGLAFVSDASSGRVKIFSAAEPPRPDFAQLSASRVDSQGATLEASVNPGGPAATAYFEYGVAPCVDGGCARTAGQAVGAGEAAVEVKSVLADLTPGTRYHFRVAADNAIGSWSSGERTFFTSREAAAPESGCPNEGVRDAPDRLLPDCRAFELVSPVDKEGFDIQALPEVSGAATAIDQSSPGGAQFTFSTFGAFAAPAGNPWISQYLATRGGSGWSTVNLTPPREGPDVLLANEFKFFTPDLSRSWLVHAAGPSLSPGAPSPEPTLYERDTASGLYRAFYTPAESDEFDLANPSSTLEFQGEGGGHTVFRAMVKPSGPYRVFDADGGAPREVSLLPDGSSYPADATVGGFAQGGVSKQVAPKSHAVSVDGREVYWTGANGTGLAGGTIYVRVDDRETRPVSETAASGDAQFWLAAADGSHALFSFGDGPAEGSLFEYSLAEGTSRRVCGELVGVVGGGEDLGVFYFVSLEAIGGEGVAGSPNLYRDDEGRVGLVATLSPEDLAASNPRSPSLVNPAPILHSASVSADGDVLVFDSLAELTGYDNRDLGSGERDDEVFRFDATGHALACISCDPTGGRPEGKEIVPDDGAARGLWSAAQVPPWQTPLMDPHVLADGGARVFFDAYASLLPRDTNGREDVYEWEGPGSGTCTEGSADYFPQNAGCLALLSTGVDPLDSEFLDADGDGGDVFFTTAQSLVGADPGSIDVYDAREFGGFAESDAALPSCEGDGCQATSEATSATPSAGSSRFSGPSNRHHRKKKRRHRKKKHTRTRHRHRHHIAREGKRK